MILSPEQPPTYLLNGPHGRLGVSRCAYTRKELQVVPINEKPPPDSVIRGQPERFIPEQILRHRIRKGQDHIRNYRDKNILPITDCKVLSDSIIRVLKDL
ncbi:uncharacterized protein OCT59_009496 [Rhizophagus irregularis]|uniref:uncharacterized protein n=1 Tax=Rhizophagus irregularis TaxID=588596 RepID=UPI003331CEF2|nr:hypothetical protein OCT59_009496 [Rhizophagus irregularis]